MEPSGDRSHIDRVVALADVFVRLERPDLALPLLQRLVAAEPDEPGLELRIAEVARMASPPEPPPPLNPSAAGLRPETLIELCLRAGALAVGRDLLRGLVRRPLEPPEAAENLASRLLALERVLRRLGRREPERGQVARPSVKHAEALIAQGRLFDGIEECRLVLERRAASTESRMWVRDLEILLAPVPDLFVPERGTPEPGGPAPRSVAGGTAWGAPPGGEGPAPPDAATAEEASLGDTPFETPRGGSPPGRARAPETSPARPPAGATEREPASRPAPEPAPASAVREPADAPSIPPDAHIDESLSIDVPFHEAGAEPGSDEPPVRAEPPAALAADADLPAGEEIHDEDERTDLTLGDPAVRRLIDRGDLAAAHATLAASGLEARGPALPVYLAALERLRGPGPGASAAIVVDAETALVGGDLQEALALYTRAAEERPDQLEVVRRARDLRFILLGGRQPPEPRPRAELSLDELRRVLLKRGGAAQRVQASAGLWGKAAPGGRTEADE